MALFDVYVKEIAGYVERMRRAGRQIREMNYPAGSRSAVDGLPVLVDNGARSDVILKEDTYVELGSPDSASCAFLLWTKDLSLLKDGRITLIGPDIHETKNGSLPFGQIMVIGGTGLKEEDQLELELGQYVSGRIEGYMIRSIPQRMWSRVSKEAVKRGFCFEKLGRALMKIIKYKLPVVEAIEILFVTSSREDVQGLEGISIQVEKIAREIKRKKFIIAEDNAYICTSGLDCSVCADKPICDSIRELITLRKANALNRSKGAGGATLDTKV